MLVIRGMRRRGVIGEVGTSWHIRQAGQLFGKDQRSLEMVTIVKTFIMEKTPPPLTIFATVAPGARRPRASDWRVRKEWSAR